jgi:hypothetical protein
MGFDKTNFKKINENAFLFNNFISKEECDRFIELTVGCEWTEAGGGQVKLCEVFSDEHTSLYNKIKNICDKDVVPNGLIYSKIEKGKFWYEHKDEMGYGGNDESKLFGGVIYINDFEGGEIFYPEEGNQFKGESRWTPEFGGEIYHPSKGDMILHPVDVWHGTEPLLSDVRYAITFLLCKEKIEH